MTINLLKKSTIALLAVAVIGIAATPVVQAKSDKSNGPNMGLGNISKMIKGNSEENDHGNSISNNNSTFSNSAVKTARTTYQQALKNIKTTYQTAVKTARTKLKAALSTAGNNFANRLTAYKAYLADLLTANTQKSTAQQTALQNYINALSAIPANQTPTANTQSVTTAKNTAKAITLTGSDPEASTLTFTVVTNPTHGTLTGTIPNLTYTPTTDFTGTDSFTFKVNDGTLDSTPATVTITVTP